MPVVPTRDPSNVTTSVAAAPVQSPAGNFGAAVADAANVLSPVALDIQMRENADLVMQAEIAVRNAEREHRIAVESRKGTDAFGVTQESEQWWADTISEQSGALKNDMQRQMFNELVQDRRQVSLDTISGYEAAERRNSFNQSSASVIEGAIEAAAESAYNPAAIALERKRIMDTVADLSDSNGWTPEMTEVELAKHMTTMHGAVVNSLMADSPLAAQEYFKQNRKEISGTARAEMDEMITARVLDHKAQGLAESYYNGVDSFAEANEKVRAIKDPDLQKATRSAVKILYADDVDAKNQVESAASDEGWKQLTADTRIEELQRSPLWQNIPGTTRVQMEAYQKAKDTAKLKEPVEDDYSTLAEAEQLIEANAIRTPEQLERYRPFITKTTYKRLFDAMQSNTELPLEDLRKAFEAREGKKRDVVGANRWKGKQWESWALLQDYARRRVKAGAQAKDVSSIVDEWYLEGYSLEDRWGFDPTSLRKALESGRTDFVFEAPEQYQTALQGAAVELGTTADQLYTKGGRDAINMLVKLDKPVTSANIKYVLEQMNAD